MIQQKMLLNNFHFVSHSIIKVLVELNQIQNVEYIRKHLKPSLSKNVNKTSPIKMY